MGIDRFKMEKFTREMLNYTPESLTFRLSGYNIKLADVHRWHNPLKPGPGAGHPHDELTGTSGLPDVEVDEVLHNGLHPALGGLFRSQAGSGDDRQNPHPEF